MLRFILLFLLALSGLALADEKVLVRHGDKDELRSLLTSLAPKVEVFVQGDALYLSGSDEEVGRAKDLLESLDCPADGIYYSLHLFTLKGEDIKQFRVHWTTPEIGLVNRPCNGGSEVYLNWFLHQGEAKSLGTPAFSGTLGKECELRLQDQSRSMSTVGCRIRLRGELEDSTRINLSFRLAESWPDSRREVETQVRLYDGDSLIVRGLAPNHDRQSSVELLALPFWGPIFQPTESEREVFLMLTAMLMR